MRYSDCKIIMDIKKYLHIFFLIGVITFKLSSVAIHVHFSHQDNDDDSQEVCELCEYAIQNQDLDTFYATPSYDAAFFYNEYSEKKNLYRSIYKKTLIDYTRFGRPPPSLV